MARPLAETSTVITGLALGETARFPEGSEQKVRGSRDYIQRRLHPGRRFKVRAIPGRPVEVERTA